MTELGTFLGERERERDMPDSYAVLKVDDLTISAWVSTFQLVRLACKRQISVLFAGLTRSFIHT